MDLRSALDFDKDQGGHDDDANDLSLETLSALTRRLEAYQQELEKVRRENRDLRRDAKALRAQLSDIVNSRVWKVTAPVRRLVEFVKK